MARAVHAAETRWPRARRHRDSPRPRRLRLQAQGDAQLLRLLGRAPRRGDGARRSDVNLPALRAQVSKRVYRGTTDLPKSNEVRTIALLPPARDALLTLPKRQGPVFRSKAEVGCARPLLSSDRRDVQIKAGLAFDSDHCTRHVCAHFMKVKLGCRTTSSPRSSAGPNARSKRWSPPTRIRRWVLEVIDAAFSQLPVIGACIRKEPVMSESTADDQT